MKKRVEFDLKLNKALSKDRDFLIQIYKEEWENIQKTAKREALVEKAKGGGAAAARALLGIAMLGGILTVTVVAPNTFSAFGRIARYRGYYDKPALKNACYYLKRRGYATVNRDGKDGYKIAVTTRGEQSFLREAYSHLKAKRSHAWDGHWRIVIFDISRKKNWARNAFRSKLRMLGFYKLQHSVFVYPYPCEKELGFLISIFKLANCVHVINAKHVSMEAELKKYFFTS